MRRCRCRRGRYGSDCLYRPVVPKRAREAATAIPALESRTDVPATDANVKTISDEADWLASGVELAFGPDGSLKAKGAPE